MCRESIEVELEIPQKKKKMLIEIERPDLNILPETRPAKIFFYKKEEPFSKYFKSEGKVLPLILSPRSSPTCERVRGKHLLFSFKYVKCETILSGGGDKRWRIVKSTRVNILTKGKKTTI